MRGSRHNGRWGSERHNGRDFDLAKSGHIDAQVSAGNTYWAWDDGPMVGCELRYYEEHFWQALTAQNERYRKKGNHDRVRTMEEFMQARQHRPEETIMQIGTMADGVDPEEFGEMVDEFLEWEQNWAEQHGQPFALLDAAIHVDEASPHAHIRRVWQYKDADGVLHVGQNKALAAAKVPLPDPTKPEGPKNNRKMVYDAMCREKWLDICEEHGYEVERLPDASRSAHIPKEQYQAIQDALAALEAREEAVRQSEARLKLRESRIERREKKQEEAEKAFQVKEDALEAQKQALADRETAVKQKELQQQQRAAKLDAREAAVTHRERVADGNDMVSSISDVFSSPRIRGDMSK